MWVGLMQSVEDLNRTKGWSSPEYENSPAWWPSNWDIHSPWFYSNFWPFNSKWNIGSVYFGFASLENCMSQFLIINLCIYIYTYIYVYTGIHIHYRYRDRDRDDIDIDIDIAIDIDIDIDLLYWFCFSSEYWLILMKGKMIKLGPWIGQLSMWV